MDRQIFWDDLNPVDTENLSDPPVFPSDTNMSCGNLVGEGSSDLSMWSSSGPSSNRHPLNPSSHESGWSSSLTINGGQGSATQERRLEAANMLLGLRAEDYVNDTVPLEDVNLNLNINETGNNQPFSQDFSVDDFLKNSDQNVGHDGTSSQAAEPAELSHPNTSGSLGSLHVSSSGGSLNLRGSSSSGTGFLTENFEGRSESLLDGQRMSSKRKMTEGVPAETSAGGISSCLYQGENNLVHSVSTQHSANTSLSMSSSSVYPSGMNPPGEQLNPIISTNVTLGASGCHSFNVVANAESSQRNCRSRIITSEHGPAPPSQWLPDNSLLPSDPWSAHQPSSLFIPFTQALDSRVIAAGTLESQPPVLPASGSVPNMQPVSLNAASISRAGSSLRSPAIAGQRTGSSTRSPTIPVQRTTSSTRAPTMVAQRSIGLREESSSRSTPRNTVSDDMVFVPATDIRNSEQDPASWGLANGSIGHVTPVSQSVNPLWVHQLPGPTWIPHQNNAGHYHRNLAEAVRQSSSPGRSGSGQGVNLSQRSANSNSSQEIAHQSSGAVRGHHRPHARAALLMDRHSDGAVSIPLRLPTTREGRNRVLSEHIRNAMQLIQREELQDILLFDHSVFYGGAADLHDRHRDLRLDVDNMSYEELLALEEQIGDVNTGLSDETIPKYLKQRKYVSLSEEAPEEVEPCCICQEEYAEGDDVGRLDCRHDFHSACIKQWLLQKNSCPICKTTGLDTEKHKKGGA